MQIFRWQEYKNNAWLQKKCGEHMYSPNMVICKPCHIDTLMYSEKECVGCRKHVIRRYMVKFDPHKHSHLLLGAEHITPGDGDI